MLGGDVKTADGAILSGMAWYESCKHCKRLFHVEAAGKFPVGDWEDVDCPYCKRVSYSRRASTTFSTRQLNPEEEQALARGELRVD
jgi:hypothetical protein